MTQQDLSKRLDAKSAATNKHSHMKHLPTALTILAAALVFVFYTDWANALLSCIALAGLVVVGVVVWLVVKAFQKSDT